MDFTNIRPFNGSKYEAFEEFCCQLAYRYDSVPQNSEFHRYRGAGGDGGVECIWKLPDGKEWGWQVKYVFNLNNAKSQLDSSIKTALKIHPKLTKYFICLPFNLTGPTGRMGKSETQKFEEYKQEWQELAKKNGMSVEFILWNKTILIDRLFAIDTNGSRARYWFNEIFLNEAWFRNHIRKALKIAEPRYSPYLGVEMPIYKSFEAFGEVPSFQKEVKQKYDDIMKLYQQWASTLSTKQSEFGPTPEISQENIELAKNLSDTLKEMGETITEKESSDVASKLNDLIKSAKEYAKILKDKFKEGIEEKHGKGAADSVPFRQFMAEYMVSFPTANYDLARETLEKLNELEKWNESYGRLIFEDVVLIYGPAGIGKTHTICDVASMRLKNGLKSIVLFGEQFTNGEPWRQTQSILGLSPSLSKDDILTALDIVGESLGCPVIIFIDALNETKPYDFWKRYLKSLIQDIKSYKWVKLCVSCRSTYLDLLPEKLKIFKLEHKGFEGIEFEAGIQFFTYYGLELPSVPLLQPEFSNPLFLKLTCESLKDAGLSRFPENRFSFSEIVDYFLASKEKKIAFELNCNVNKQLVRKAISQIIAKMQEDRKRSLSWEDAEKVCTNLWPYQERSRSLLEALIRESLLREDREAGDNVVLFSFERLGDFLLAQKLLEQVINIEELKKAFEPSGLLYFIIQSLSENMGLLEALAVLIPEKFDAELSDVVEKSLIDLIIPVVIESIRWRKPSSITEGTKQIVKQALSNREIFVQTMDVIFSKSVYPKHPLNANWFHQFTLRDSMSFRDRWLSPFLHFEYDRKSSVRHLIDWAFKVDPRDVSSQVISLWVTILIWFLSASDRRVRDNATKAIVRLTELHCDIWPEILDKFYGIDDDYIIERLLSASYCALIRSQNIDALKDTAGKVFQQIFKNKQTIPTNVMIRDSARAILELALERHALPDNINPQDFRPPYKSNWPGSLPSDDEIKKLENSFKNHKHYGAIRQLIDSMQPEHSSIGMYGDFGRYIFQSALDIWDTQDITIQNLSNLAIKIIFEELGYDIDTHGEFDRYIMSKYGPGRGRPSWAERIGKKYQWIALYRLVGMVSDNFRIKKDSWDKPSHDLYGRRLKDIDPTILLKKTFTTKKNSWWSPVRYNFEKYKNISDAEWLSPNDFPDSSQMLLIKDPKNGRAYYVLLSFPEWTSRKDKEYPYRRIWMQLRSYLVPKNSYAKLQDWLKTKNLIRNWMPEGYEFYDSFIGEYPWAIPFREFFKEQPEWKEINDYKRNNLKILPTSNSLLCERDRDESIENTLSIEVPAREFFLEANLNWDGRGSYLNNKSPAFIFPSVYEAGPYSLLVEKQFLEELLEKENLVLVWTVLGEKQIIQESSRSSYRFPIYNCIHILKDKRISSSKVWIENE